MLFSIVKRGQASDEDLLNDVVAVKGKLHKESLTIKEYDAIGKYNSSTIIRRFGSWNNALNLTGTNISNRYYSDEEFVENIKNVWLTLGRQPTRREMNDRKISHISSTSYIRKFGSWYNALEFFVFQIESENDSKIQVPVIDEDGFTHHTSRDPNDRLKVRVLMRDGNKCKICGVTCDGGLHKIHFDHVVPWSKGGETTLENLRVLCAECNLALGNSNSEE